MKCIGITKIAFTGNRGISHKNPTVIESLYNIHHCAPGAIWITGMALGIDTIVAKYAYQHKIPFEAHLPFPADVQTTHWPLHAKATHAMLLSKAAKVKIYGKDYTISLYQTRNEGMARASDIVVAFNLNERGGAVNMINYCLSKNMTVLDGFNDLKVMLSP